MDQVFQVANENNGSGYEVTHRQINDKSENFVKYCNDTQNYTNSNLRIKVEPPDEDSDQAKTKLIQEDCDLCSDEIKIEHIDIKTEYFSDDFADCDKIKDFMQDDCVKSEPAEKNHLQHDRVDINEQNGQKIITKYKFKLHGHDAVNVESTNDINALDSASLVNNCGETSRQRSKSTHAVKIRKYSSSELVPEQFCHETVATDRHQHTCDICKKTFRYASLLLKHKRIHTGEKPYACFICNKRFTHFSTLKNHKLIHTGEKPYACDVCNKRFTHLSTLSNHKAIHTGEKPYVCDVCNKGFILLSYLNSHKPIHTGEKPYACDVCNKRFTHLSTFKNHKVIHTGQRPYICDVCNKGFVLLSYLNSHRLIHTGEKPYVCNVCKKQFTKVSQLKRHKLIHTGDKPFACELCYKQFTLLSNLNRHKLIHASSNL